MGPERLYAEKFYEQHREGARRSAREIVPLLLELLRPRSVVDVGCGAGTWLSVFREHGIEDVLGVDGDHVPRTLLEIPEERFTGHDLATRFHIERRFDAVLSLEVAEHLPESASEVFVDSLVNLGNAIVFSAAIPHQGGQGHVNEQWPDYWIDRFHARGYEVIDCLRRKVWPSKAIEWWYAQNLFLFVERSRLESDARLRQELNDARGSPVSLVHPRHYLHAVWRQDVLRAALEIVDVIPRDETFILLDDNRFGYDFGPQRRVVRFPEAAEWYWKSPPDDEVPIEELIRLKGAGANFVVIGWPAFDWLSLRPRLEAHLFSSARCLHRTERVLVFGL